MSTAPWWPLLVNAVSILLGVVLGLMAEPVKAWVLRRSELRLARREIYAELAGYLAGIQRAHRGAGHDDYPENVRPAADFESSKRICKLPPKFEVIQWYKSNRLDVLLRVDPHHGIRRLSEEIVVLYEQTASFVGLPQRVIDCLGRHEKHLDGRLLRKYIRAGHGSWSA